MLRLRLFFHTALLFVAAQVIGLIVAIDLSSLGFPGALQSTGATLASFLVLFFALTLFLIVLLHLYRGKILYRMIFSAIVFLGLLKLFEVVFPSPLAIGVAALFVTGLYLLPMVWVHDLVVIFAAAGIGSLFGLQFTWQGALWLLGILSVYDFFAVFITRHMVSFEHETIREQASFALMIPEEWHDMRASLTRITPGSGFLILGGGDVILPMFLTTSLVATHRGAIPFVIAGMVFGLFINHAWLMSTRKALPALPCIAFGALVGMLIGFLF